MRGLGIIRSSLNGRYVSHGDPSEASCVLVCSFGYGTTRTGETDPGAANEGLARFIGQRFSDKPILAQYEVDLALRTIYNGRAADYVIGDPKAIRPNRYLDTREVLRWGISIMRSRDWGEAILVAHSYHIARVDAVAHALGIDTVVPDKLPEIWDERSGQFWTRSPGLWRVREILVMTSFAARGWLS